MTGALWVVALVALVLIPASALQFSDEFYEGHILLPALSLKPPFYPAGNKIGPYWDFGGATAVSSEHVRLTSLVKNQVGHISNQAGIESEDFALFVELHVHGEVNGADGMAIWLTDTPVNADGPVLGGPVRWNGAVLMLDSFDNDHRGNNPRVSLLLNDGTKIFASGSDGEELEAGGCMFGFRNSGALTVRIAVQGSHISVSLGGSDVPMDQYHKCVQNVQFAHKGKVFVSVTAATGGLYDNHDLLGVAAFEILDAQAQQENRHKEEAYQKELLRKQAEEFGNRLHANSKPRLPPANAPHTAPATTHKPSPGAVDEHMIEIGLPEHHTRPALAFHFSNIFTDLKNVHQATHPDHQAFKDDLRLPDMKNIKTDEERYAFILDAIYTLEHHSDFMIKAFEGILTLTDDERFRMTDNHHQFATAFQSLHENVATKQEVEFALAALAGKVSLLKATRKIHAVVESLLDAVEGPDSPVGILGVIGKQIEPAKAAIRDAHASNRRSLVAAQNELQELLSAFGKSSWSLVDYAMLVELALLALFVLFQLFGSKSRERPTLL